MYATSPDPCEGLVRRPGLQLTSAGYEATGSGTETKANAAQSNKRRPQMYRRRIKMNYEIDAAASICGNKYVHYLSSICMLSVWTCYKTLLTTT